MNASIQTAAGRRCGATMLAAALALAMFLALPARALAKYASIVLDAETGEVLHEEGADTRNYPASLTKMMTLYMTFEALQRGKLRLEEPIAVSEHAAAQDPSRLGLRAGQTIKVEYAILGLVTKSANDAAVTLAEALGGSEQRFAQMMTAKARQLGMTGTSFRNASGLPDPGQLTTARDLATLGRALIYDFPQYYPYFSRRSFTFNGAVHQNHNHLMSRYTGMDGIKTGYIRASGFNLAASAVRDGRRLIAVVMGGQSTGWRDNHLAKLLDEGFAQHRRHAPVIARNEAQARLASAAQAVRNAGAPGFVPPAPLRKPDEDEPVALPTPDKAGIDTLVTAATLAEGARQAPRLSLASATLPAQPASPGVKAGPVPDAPGRWGIQVGAFTDRTAGQKAMDSAAERLPRLLGAAYPQVIEVPTRDGALYRARLMGLDENSARAACARLEQAGKTCLTVPPHRS